MLFHTLSIRWRVKHLRRSYRTLWCLSHSALQLSLYQLHLARELNPVDHTMCRRHVDWLLCDAIFRIKFSSTLKVIFHLVDMSAGNYQKVVVFSRSDCIGKHLLFRNNSSVPFGK